LKVVFFVARTRHVDVWLVVCDPLSDEFGLLLPDVSNIWIVIIMRHSQIKLILCVSHNISGNVQVFDEVSNTTSNPGVSCTIRKDDVGVFFKIKSLVLSSKFVESPAVIRDNTMLYLAVFSPVSLVKARVITNKHGIIGKAH